MSEYNFRRLRMTLCGFPVDDNFDATNAVRSALANGGMRICGQCMRSAPERRRYQATTFARRTLHWTMTDPAIAMTCLCHHPRSHHYAIDGRLRCMSADCDCREFVAAGESK